MEIIKNLPHVPKPTFTLNISFEELVQLRDAINKHCTSFSMYTKLDTEVRNSE